MFFHMYMHDFYSLVCVVLGMVGFMLQSYGEEHNFFVTVF